MAQWPCATVATIRNVALGNHDERDDGMDFAVSEETATMLEMIGEFVERELLPIEGEMLHGDPAVVEELVAAAQVKVRQMGLWAPNHPVEFGGLGLSMVDHGLLSEAMGRSPLGHTVSCSPRPLSRTATTT